MRAPRALPIMLAATTVALPTRCLASCQILIGASRGTVAWAPNFNGKAIICAGNKCREIAAKHGVSFFDFAAPPGTPVSASAQPAGPAFPGQDCIALVPAEAKTGQGGVALSALSGIFALLGGIISAMFIAGTGRDRQTSSWIELYRGNLRRFVRDSSVDIRPPQAPDMDGRGLRRINTLRRKLSDRFIPADSDQLPASSKRATVEAIEKELDRAIVEWFGTPVQRLAAWYAARPAAR